MRLGAAISLVPAAVLFALFFLLPLLVLLDSSFGTWDAVGFTFTGGKNFADMAQDPVFWTAMRNTLAYVGLGVFVQTPLSVLAGILLATRLRGWRVFRAIIFIPFVISGAAYALVFNLGLGILARLMPQMQVYFIGVPLSILGGFLILAVILATMMGTFLEYFGGVLHELTPG